MVTVTNNLERIVDGKNYNNFGVLFHSTKEIEKFQEFSGMKGAYKVEYQHHYINLVGRIEADGQILDIAIPMVMFNYHQEVSGASVEFNLGEVGTANNEAMGLAKERFKEFSETEMYKALCEIGIDDWTFHGMNSVHAHPHGVNRFSGTDLRTNIDHPGVNFPLNTGIKVPNFASIIQHRQNHAEIIHTEYRLFSGIANGERVYLKGRTLTINRGIELEPEPEYQELGPGPIDAIFGTTRPQPPKPEKQKERPDFILKDGLTGEEGDTFAKEMMEVWKECPFEIDTSMILKTNIQRGRGRLQNSYNVGWGGNASRGKQQSLKGLDEINEGLFGKNEEKTEGSREYYLHEKRDILAEHGFTRTELLKFPQAKIDKYFDLVELSEAAQGIPRDKNDFTEPPYQEKVIYLMQAGYVLSDIVESQLAEINDKYWEERLEEFEQDEEKEAEKTDDEVLDYITNMLIADNIISKIKLSTTSEKDIISLAEEIYGPKETWIF